MNKTVLLLSAATIVGMVSTSAAQAQTNSVADTGTVAAPAPNAGIQDIVVTAQRRTENLQKAAIAVSAVTGSALVNASVSDTANLTKLVPALVVQPSGGSGVNLYIRGVGSLAGNSFAENAVSFNFAGVYIGRPTAPAGTFFDLERVEVLKGPQGTLYGRNATGGAINVLPKAPVLGEVSGDATFEYGNYDAKKGIAALNVPLGETVALRVAGQVIDRDGYMSNGADDEKGQAARGSLLIKPSDDFSITLIGDYFRQRGKGPGSVLVPSATAPGAPSPSDRIDGSDPRSSSALLPSYAPLILSGLALTPKDDAFQRNEFYGIAGIVEGNLGFAKLTVIPAYRKSKPNFLSYTPGFYARVIENTDQMSLEARLTSTNSGPLQYVVGGYFFYEQQDAVNLFNQGPIAFTQIYPRTQTESRAVFGQATYALTDTLRLVAGGRYTSEEKKATTRLRNLSVFSPGSDAFSTSTNTRDDKKFTWKAGIEYDLAPRSLLYANVATGFKAGGFYAGFGDNTFAPEKLTAYTVGMKNRFWDNKLQLNFEGFYWKYKDQQVSYVGPVLVAPGIYGPAGVTANVGKATIYGAEVDLQFAFTSDDLFGANVQYLHSNYDSFEFLELSAGGGDIRTTCSATPNTSLAAAPPGRIFNVNCTGKPGLNSPKWTANLSYDHTFRFGDYELIAGVRSRLESSRYMAIQYLETQRQKAYGTVDAQLTLNAPGDRWSLTGFVNNITDKTVYAGSQSHPIFSEAYNPLRPPRTYGVRASVRF